MDISIIIVNYKTEKLTSDCLASIYASDLTGLSYEVFVVDNASGDGSIEAIEARYPKASVIKNHENGGFAKANNIAIRRSKGDYILLLNSDTVVEKDTLKESVRRMQAEPEIGALGCKVILPSGKLDPACKRSFPTPINGIYHTLKLDSFFPRNKVLGAYDLTYLDEDESHYVDCVMGAYMMVSRTVIETVGLLDEDYFMYGEDIDWCYRIKDAGFKILYFPVVKITHYKKASGIGKSNPKVIAAFYDAMGIFYQKHYQGKYNPVTSKAVLLGTQVMKKRALKQCGKEQ